MQFTNIRLSGKRGGTLNMVNMVSHEVPTAKEVNTYLINMGFTPSKYKVEFSSSFFEVRTEPLFQTVIDINLCPDIIEDNEIKYRQTLNIETFDVPTVREIEDQIKDAGYDVNAIEYWYVIIPLFEREPSLF